jgi:hypothetical protein
LDSKRRPRREYPFHITDGYIASMSLKLLFFVIYSLRFTIRKANKPFSKTDTMFFKKIWVTFHAFSLSRNCEKSSQVLAHTFSQSHTFSQFARKCVGSPHTFLQIARKRAIARKRGLTVSCLKEHLCCYFFL